MGGGGYMRSRVGRGKEEEKKRKRSRHDEGSRIWGG